jgi:hypothetical protein
MNNYPFDRNLTNESEVLDYYIDAINYRNAQKEESAVIAMHVFDRTHPILMLTFPIDDTTDSLRNEFGALEAPGWSEDETKSLEESEDEAWEYVHGLVNKAKQNRTV